MNILIICSNRNTQPIAVMPLGACIAADAAHQAGHNVAVLDLMFVKDISQKLNQTLSTFKPDIVGISIRNIDNNDMKNPRMFADDIAQLVQMIKNKSNAQIILGGAAISIMPEQLLRHTGTTIAVLGSTETVFPQLLNALQQKTPFNNVNDIAWLENDTFMRTEPPAHPWQYSKNCFVPDFLRWLDVKPYFRHSSSVPVQTKRGCPYNCVYCTYAIGEGRQYQLCKPDAVAAEIRKLASRGIRDIEFVDNVFNSPYEHAMEICDCLAREKLPVRLQSMELNPRFIDDALLTAMENAGFVGIGLTAESADDTVLKNLGKDYTADDVRRAAQVISRHKLPCLWIFLFGGPGETAQSVQRTFDFACTYIRKSDTAFFNVGIRIYPGTELEHIARTQGTLQVSEQEMLSTVFYFSPQLDIRWLTETIDRTLTENLNFIDPDSFTLPALSAILRFGHYFGVKPPLWKHTRLIRRGLQLLGKYK
jgi:radical SAM superfamily enzyme YgiQ (UPF0313 family)